ncbi:MAG: aminopeptidase P family protein [Candidatus Aminicenantes bacterium]|nr:aminopeptidase P family protein [Candidatus Aminicenantes bacterium]
MKKILLTVPKLFLIILLFSGSPGASQDYLPFFSADIPKEEFAARRAAVYEAIGEQNIAIIQGATYPWGYTRFRQDTDFYYLSGVISPHAYLLLDGSSKMARLYLTHRDDVRNNSEGRMLSADDPELVAKVTGIEEVYGVDLLAGHLTRFIWWSNDIPAVYVPFSPTEVLSGTRDHGYRTAADIASDPWDGRPTRKGQFVKLLKDRFPALTVKNLSPLMDRIRLIKSMREIKKIRTATRIGGEALMECMRSTKPERFEYELDAVARFLFLKNGAQGAAYYSIVASGPNAWYAHYHENTSRMKDGDMVVMDFGPDLDYYVSDVTRMWPVNGQFSKEQKELYSFYLACYRSIVESIKPGITPRNIQKRAAEKMEAILGRSRFSKEVYTNAALDFIADYKIPKGNAILSMGGGHLVGMSAHEFGAVEEPLRPGMVITVEPDFRVPEERLYFRVEDTVVVTEEGADILSNFVPLDIEDIEKLMKEPGILDTCK